MITLKSIVIVKTHIILYNIVMVFKKRLFTVLLLVAVMAAPVFSKKKAAVTVPSNVQTKISETEDSPKSWYICELKGKTKAGNIVIGPVEHREQILLVWIANSIVPNKDYCIAKNKTYITKNPETFFKDEFETIKADISEMGLAETYEKYFFTNFLTRATKLTLTDEEAGITAQEETPTQEEPSQIVKETEAEPTPEPVAETKTEPVEEPAAVTKTVPVTESKPVAETKPAAEPQPETKTVTQTVPITTTTNKSTGFLEPTITEEGDYVYVEPKDSKETTYSIDQEIDLDSLKAELKSQLRDELMTELRDELANYEPKAVEEPKPVVTAEPEPQVTEETKPQPVQEAEPQPVQQAEPKQVEEPQPATEPQEQPQKEAEPEPVASEEQTQEPAEESSFELPISTTVANNVNRYQRENLLDYAPKKVPALPTDEDENEIVLISNPDKADSSGCTLLMMAARAGNDREVKNLILSGAKVNLKDKEGWNALMYAVRYQQNESIIDELISSGINVKEKNKYDISALTLAATYNENPEILKKLLNYYSPAEKELMQAFILMLSDNSSSEYSKTVKTEAIIQKGIALNTFYNGKTPLMYAAQYCTSTSVIRKLLEYGAATTTRSADGKTAFDYAKQNPSLPHDNVYWALNKK